jgi:hypothetical protein
MGIVAIPQEREQVYDDGNPVHKLRFGPSKPYQPDKRGSEEKSHLRCFEPGESKVRRKPISASNSNYDTLEEAEQNASREKLDPQMHCEWNKYRRQRQLYPAKPR